jgi:hypothetical protein
LNTKISSSLRLTSAIRIAVIAAFALSVLTIGFSSISLVQAQDQENEPIVGYRIIGEETAGPYTVEVQVSPPAPYAGIVRFAVRVRDTETGEDVEDAIVRVFVTPSEKGEKQYSPGLNSPVDPVYYLSQLDADYPGLWAVDVEVESELGEGSTVMSIQVGDRGRGGDGNAGGQALFALVTLSFVIGIGWVWYQSKKALKRRDQQSS